MSSMVMVKVIGIARRLAMVKNMVMRRMVVRGNMLRL